MGGSAGGGAVVVGAVGQTEAIAAGIAFQNELVSIGQTFGRDQEQVAVAIAANRCRVGWAGARIDLAGSAEDGDRGSGGVDRAAGVTFQEDVRAGDERVAGLEQEVVAETQRHAASRDDVLANFEVLSAGRGIIHGDEDAAAGDHPHRPRESAIAPHGDRLDHKLIHIEVRKIAATGAGERADVVARLVEIDKTAGLHAPRAGENRSAGNLRNGRRHVQANCAIAGVGSLIEDQIARQRLQIDIPARGVDPAEARKQAESGSGIHGERIDIAELDQVAGRLDRQLVHVVGRSAQRDAAEGIDSQLAGNDRPGGNLIHGRAGHDADDGGGRR